MGTVRSMQKPSLRWLCFSLVMTLEPFLLPLGAVRDAACVQAAADLVIAIPDAFALDWWASFPRELLISLGCACVFENFPPLPGQPTLLSLTAHSLPLQLTPSALQEWLRRYLVIAVLRQEESAAKARGDPCVMLELQVVACTVWSGADVFTRADFQKLWTFASQVTDLQPGARVYSGPLPQPAQVSARALDDSFGKAHRNKRTGQMVLTFHPEICGGGGKTEVQPALKSRLAQVCLEKGCALSEVNRAIGQVMQKAALSSLIFCRYKALSCL